MGDEIHEDFTVTRNGKRFGCHCDTSDDDEIDGCVIDTDYASSCLYATLPSGRVRRSKWTCEYWKPMPAKEAERRAKSQ